MHEESNGITLRYREKFDDQKTRARSGAQFLIGHETLTAEHRIDSIFGDQ